MPKKVSVIIPPVVNEPVVSSKMTKGKKKVQSSPSSSPKEMNEVPKLPKGSKNKKETKTLLKKSNNWINHVKAFANKHKIKYMEALKHKECKEEYSKTNSVKNREEGC